MTKQEIHDALSQATESVIEATLNVHTAQETLSIAKADLITVERKHTLDGLDGKNAETRKAQLAELTHAELAAVEDAEIALSSARLELTIAQIKHQFSRDLLRLYTDGVA